eukprot:g25141.t1
MDNVIHCFHFKGKKNHSIYLPCPISCMSLLQITKSRVAKALVVALQNGEVRLYNGKHLIATVETNDVVSGIRLGTFGREEGSMVLSFKSGALMVKILQRNANLDGASINVGPPPEQDWAWLKQEGGGNFEMHMIGNCVLRTYLWMCQRKPSCMWSRRAENESRRLTCTGPSNGICASFASPPLGRMSTCWELAMGQCLPPVEPKCESTHRF